MIFKDWATLIIALLGLGLSIYNAVIAKKKERREREQKESDAHMQEEEWQLLEEMTRASEKGHVICPEPGSSQYRMVERLAERGMVERLPGRCYGVAGQSFKIG